MTENSLLRFGVLGAAKIAAAALIDPTRIVREAQVSAIAARDPARASLFAQAHNVPRVHPTYDALLDDPDIDAIYIPLPNSLHAEWAIRALRAGKHVLCEKPFAANASQAEQMAAAANQSGLVLSEGFAYWHHPLAARLKEILAAGELGTIRHFEAEFSFFLGSLDNNRFRYDLAGGVTMDAGCYAVSLLRWLAGAEPGVTSAEARVVLPQVDEYMRADLRFSDGRTARITCQMRSPHGFRATAVVQGDRGELHVTNPYHPHSSHAIQVRTPHATRDEQVAALNVYECQLRAFVRSVREGAPIVTDAANGVANMRVIDAMYEHAGLRRRGT